MRKNKNTQGNRFLMGPDAPNLSYDLLTASLLKDIVTLEMTQQEQPLGEANSLYDSWATVSKKTRLRKNNFGTLQSAHPSFIHRNINERGVSGSFNAEFLIKTCHIESQLPPCERVGTTHSLFWSLQRWNWSTTCWGLGEARCFPH